MKEFLRFLMCVIIATVLVFVYIFLNDQNNYYIEQMDKLSGDNENIITGFENDIMQNGETTDNTESGDSQNVSDNTFSGDIENTESGDIFSGDTENIESGDISNISTSGDNNISGD